MSKLPVALQMYTVRDEASRDFAGTLARVAEMGYRGVELAGTGGLSSSELRVLLQNLNLEIAANHAPLDKLETSLEEVVEYNIDIGNELLVCPFIPEERRRTADDYRRLGEVLNTIGMDCQEHGIQLCYHNHAFEFQRFDGRTGLDILFGATFPDVVMAELDVYWIEYGGENAVQTIRRYADRVPLIHLKDMAPGPERTFAEVGEGILDMEAIIAVSREVGVEWLIVEQDVCRRPSLESARISLENLKSRGHA